MRGRETKGGKTLNYRVSEQLRARKEEVKRMRRLTVCVKPSE